MVAFQVSEIWVRFLRHNGTAISHFSFIYNGLRIF
jgi:hypothetical protein